MKICIIGGTGFVGTYLSSKLAAQGHVVKVISRHPERHRHLRTLPGIKLVNIDFFGNKVLERQIDTYDVVINLAGILNSQSNNSFTQVHEQVALRIAQASKAVGTSRMLHMSALNADEQAASDYLRSKGRAQKALFAIDGLNVTSFSPSVIFGPGDSFFNRFAQLLTLMPVVFPLTCASARFAPVYVGDVADAFINSMNNELSYGKNYNLCGPETFSLAELVRYTAELIDSSSMVVPLNNFLSKPLSRFIGLFPGAPITVDNYYSMLKDSVCSAEQQNTLLNELSVHLHAIDCFVPQYLAGQDFTGQMDFLRQKAQR